MNFYAAIRRSTIETETHRAGEEFIDLDSFGGTIETALSKSRSSAKLHSHLVFNVEVLMPIVRIAQVEVKEV